jgi:transcription-repair coupling factor (superfamily II helicase)
MYLQLLSEAIAEEKGEPPPPRPAECLTDLRLDAHIPEEYIENLSLRLDVYRKIAALNNDAESLDLTDELTDRFGPPPPSIQGLITVALLRNLAGKLGVKEITDKNGVLFFYLSTATLEQIQSVARRFKGRVTVDGSEKPYLAVKMLDGEDSVAVMKEVLERFGEATA